MDIFEKIEKAKAKLMIEYPYFGSLASVLRFKINEDIDSFLTDGDEYQYNDDYLKELSVDEVAFTLANAAMHKILSHGERKSERENWLWQLASDYAVNAVLVQNGFVLPDRANYDSRFDGMYAEEIYATLKSEILNEEYNDDENNDTGYNETSKKKREERYDKNLQNRDENLPQNPIEAEFEGDFEEILKSIHQKMKNQGEIPKGLERIVPEFFENSIDWRSELYRFINTHAKSDFSLYPPNSKYLYMGYALPSQRSELLKIAIAIDTSGSIDKKLLGRFFNELQNILKSFPNYEIDLIEADMKIHSHKVYLPGDFIEYKVTGGGGTDFRPVFEYVEKNLYDISLILYFTDGMGIYPDKEPFFDVV